jgi:hypothetical protein
MTIALAAAAKKPENKRGRREFIWERGNLIRVNNPRGRSFYVFFSLDGSNLLLTPINLGFQKHEFML